MILLTGGLGFIGSHIAIELLTHNYSVIILDNLSNSSLDVLNKIEMITDKKFIFYQGDYQDETLLTKVFTQHTVDCVIHLAAYKSVSESMSNPLKYYQNNISGLITLLSMMETHHIKNMIYSSSATVYAPSSHALKETSPKEPINPYGQTKLMAEKILFDLKDQMNIIILRYFNPVGCHSGGLIGDNPTIASNLFPHILNTIRGKSFGDSRTEPCVQIFGCDYATYDGTAIRDYIHITDLAKGHIQAMSKLSKGIQTYNLGTGKGYSVLEVVSSFNKYTNIRYQFKDRRSGDAPAVFADVSLARQELDWRPTKSLEDMIVDSLKFVKMNPL